MTLITVGTDTTLLLRQLRQRLADVDNRIATRRIGGDAFVHSAALVELFNERAWLQGLIQSVQGVEQEQSCQE